MRFAGPRRPRPGPAPGLPALRHRHPHLGRSSRRHLRRPRALAPVRASSAGDHHRDVRGGAVLDPGAGPDPGAAAEEKKENRRSGLIRGQTLGSDPDFSWFCFAGV